MTPATVHYGHADAVHAERPRVLDAAYAAHARALRPPRADAAARPDRRLDQQAHADRGGCSLNPTRKCLTGLDRLRPRSGCRE